VLLVQVLVKPVLLLAQIRFEPKMGDEPAGDATAPTDGKTEPTMGAVKT